MQSEKTILAVGLEPGVQSLLSLFLARTARVRHAHNLREALSVLEEKSVDLVVGRLERCGATLCQVMRQSLAWQDIPVVLILSDDAVGGPQFAEQIGANALLPSSLARDQIIHTAKRFLSSGLERARPRVAIRLPVQLSTDLMLLSGQAHNISRGGIYVEAGCEIPTKTRVEVQINLPELDCTISPKGEIVWHCEGQQPGSRGMGIQFVHMAQQEMRALDTFIDLRRSAPSPAAFG